MAHGGVSRYTDRITSILPTEFVGVYLTVTQIVKEDLGMRQPLLLLALAACLALIPVFLKRIKGISERRHHVVVLLSFLVWAYALGDAFQPGAWIPYDLYFPSLGTVLLVVWGLVPFVLNMESTEEVATDAH